MKCVILAGLILGMSCRLRADEELSAYNAPSLRPDLMTDDGDNKTFAERQEDWEEREMAAVRARDDAWLAKMEERSKLEDLQAQIDQLKQGVHSR